MADIKTEARVDLSQVDALLRPDDRATALQAAVRRTQVTFSARIARKVGSAVHMPISAIKRKIHATTPSKDDPTSIITVKRSKVPMRDFLTSAQRMQLLRRPSKPFRLRVKKSKPAEHWQHAFVAMMSNGHLGIFRRIKDDKKRRIQEIYGPTLVGVLANEADGGDGTIIEAAVKDAAEVLQKNIDSQIKRFQAKYAKEGNRAR